MPPIAPADVASAEHDSICARISAIYPDRRSFIIEFDRPVTDTSFRKRQAAFARAGAGGAAGLIDIADKLQIGMKVAVSVDLRKAGLANVTAIRIVE